MPRRLPLLASGVSGTAIAADPPRASWGKAQVGLERYRADAVEGGRAGLAGTGQIDPVALNTAQQISRITEGANTRARYREVRTALQTTTDQCLTAKGYVRFTPTRAQRGRLEKLKRGTPARHAHLHALASDPAVLARQSATVEVLPVE